MSRQQGRRQRSAAEQNAIREKAPTRRSRTPLVERQQWGLPITSGRRWAAVLGATAVSVTSFSLVAVAIVEAGDDNRVAAAASLVGAALLVPLLLLVVGFVSRAASPWKTAAVWSPVLVVVFAATSFIAGEIATGFVLAVGIGIAYAMRAEQGIHQRAWRVWAAVGLALYVKVVYLLSPELAILAAPLLPAAAIAIIDSVAERRLED